MNILSYDQWQCAMVQETPDDAVMNCPECEGEGVVCVACDCCGHEREVNCEMCESSGEVIFSQLKFTDQKKCFSMQEYNNQLAYDLNKLVNWSSDLLCLPSYGFAMATTISPHSGNRVIVRLDTGAMFDPDNSRGIGWR